MSTSPYVFTNAQQVSELERLQMIERIFDLASHQRILASGIAANWHCLEVGAGAGSIAHWLATVVGDGGKVVAVDLDTQFMTDMQLPNVEVLQADICRLPPQENTFDLVHARYLLIHLPDFEIALTKMIDLLKPGGWLVLEEPDFLAARVIAGKESACQSVQRVNRAIAQMFASRGMDCALGARLPAILQELGLHLRSIQNDAHLCNGGSGVATMMQLSTRQLAEKYMATGEASQSDLEQYCLFADDPNAWAIYYASVGIIAQKPAV
jgi:SAM-dependent methyltransferase